MKAFGAKYFAHTAYINLEKETHAADIFSYDLDSRRIIQELGTLIVGQQIVPRETLLILDEIQACPDAIASLKYFSEELPELHVICAGSLLGVELKRQNIAFPVGKVDRLRMYPMSFYEFLMADDGADPQGLPGGTDAPGLGAGRCGGYSPRQKRLYPVPARRQSSYKTI